MTFRIRVWNDARETVAEMPFNSGDKTGAHHVQGATAGRYTFEHRVDLVDETSGKTINRCRGNKQ